MALAGADVITVMIGWNDWQGPCFWEGWDECFARTLPKVQTNLTAILDEISLLREGKPTVLRVVTYYDPYVGWSASPGIWGFEPAETATFEARFSEELTRFNAMLCRVAESHGGVCVDTRTPINGRQWDVEALPEPAEGAIVMGGDDHLHPVAAGHQLIARGRRRSRDSRLSRSSAGGLATPRQAARAVCRPLQVGCPTGGPASRSSAGGGERRGTGGWPARRSRRGPWGRRGRRPSRDDRRAAAELASTGRRMPQQLLRPTPLPLRAVPALRRRPATAGDAAPRTGRDAQAARAGVCGHGSSCSSGSSRSRTVSGANTPARMTTPATMSMTGPRTARSSSVRPR